MRIVIIVMVLLAAAGCGASPTPAATAAPTVQIDLGVNPQPPTVGVGSLILKVTKGGKPLDGLKLDVRGDMTHAGMKPILGSVVTDAQGKASLPFRWTMGGDWIVT